MEQSILKSTKKILNVGVDDTSFDLDIITHINSAFSHLQQLGVGPSEGFAIEDDSAMWGDFVDGPLSMVSLVKSNVYIRVRSLFDPPTMPHVATSFENILTESDNRLLLMREETEWQDPNPPASKPEDPMS